MSFRLKTIIGIALIESVLLLILVASSLSYLYESNEKQLLERATTTSKLFASAAKDAVLATDLARLNSLAADMLSQSDVAYVRVRDAAGNVLVAVGDGALLEDHRAIDTQLVTVDDGVFDALATIEEVGIHFGQVELGLSTQHVESMFSEAQQWFSTIAITEVLLVALFSFLLGTYLSRGLIRLRDASLTISESGPGVQLDVSGNDEIGDVARAFNEMSRSLQKSYEQLQASVQQSEGLQLRAERNWAKNQAILATSLDAIITVDEQGRVIDYNPAAESIFGWSAAEIKGQIMADFIVPKALRAAHQQGMDHYLKTGDWPVLNQRIQLSALNKSGRQFPVEVTISDTSTPEGPLFTAFLRDISQHIADQTELRLAATAFETIEPMFITDDQANIIRANQAFTRMTGYEEAEVIGRNPRLWASGKHAPEFYQALWSELVAHGKWTGETYNRRKNGEIFPELLSISAVRDTSEKTTHYVAHQVDISKQKAREEQLRLASLEAKKADEAKGRFLAVMSHEIRTPMNAVLGILDLLKETPLTAKQRHLLDTGCESSELLLSIINSILDFSKMEAGKLQLDLRPFDLHQALRNVVDLFRAQAEQKQIQLALHLDATLPNFVKGDQYRLRQILVNLIGNAIKFTDQGAITVSVRAQPQDADTVRIVCRVEDTGIGIPEDQQGILFQEFSMVDQSHSRHADGTGLGLAISKWLVNLMHGEIGVSSQPGVGSCFNFRVNVQRASAEDMGQSTQLAPADLSYLNARILLAEDNPANQKIFKAMLENTGLHVDVVGDGYAAVEAVRSQKYDLVLMDVSMPRMDGIEATHAIRHLEPPCSNIPIIAMTAHSLSGDRERLIAEGMNDYLSKPLKKSDLLQGILRWISTPAPMENHPGEEIKAFKPRTESHPKTVATQLIDESVLEQLVRDTSAEVVPELLRGYIEDAFQRVELIKAAIDERNAKQLEFETHTLGSSAAAYGNPELYRLAREIEQRCRAKDVEGAFETALPLETLAVASLTALTQRLDKGF